MESIKNIKTLLINQTPLPYHQIGSWTQRYGNLITSEINPFDYVICPPVDSSQIKSNFTNYRFAKKIKYEKITKKIFKYTYYHFLKQLQKILKEEKIIFIKYWNEWAEGNYLEPDLEYGNSFLETIKKFKSKL